MYNASKVKAVHDLAPEQQKALTVLLNNLPKMSELFLQSDQPATKFCITGFMAFSNKTLPKLPHDESWIWNQSNGKVTVKAGDNYVTLQKLNTRKKKNCPKPPSYKVWMCYISRSPQTSHYLNFIWCEKGVPAKDSSSSASPDSNRSESSDGSSENTSPDSFYHNSFEQNSPPESSFGSPFRRSSLPGSVPTASTHGFQTNFESTVQVPISQPPLPLVPKNDSPHLPSLEILLFLRKNQEKTLSPAALAESRKRSAPATSLMHQAKKQKLNPPLPIEKFSLPPLRMVPPSASTNDFRFTPMTNSCKEEEQKPQHPI